jgi:tetratricopeptide (TPR) repeat protein
VLWAFYGFRYYALPNSTEKAFSVVDHLSSGRRPDAINTLPGKTIYLLDRAHVLPEAYTYGLADIIVESGTYSSVLGTLYPTARWFYFPVAFAIKSSIALLLSLLIALLTLRLYRERRREMLFLLVPAVTYFALSMTSGLNIGVRHILPVYPFFIVVAAAGVCALARKHRVFSFALVALLIFHAFTAARTAPNYIAFSNDLWGGTDHTHRWISDSNVDWGQNLKVVKAYLEREGIRDCWFAYFGPAELAHLYQPCHPMPVSGWTQTYEDIETMPPVIEGLVLISTEGLPPIDEQFESIAKTEPLTILGGSIKVYRGRFEVPLAAAFSHVGRGRQLLMSGDMDGAIGEGREAVKFAPEHPRMNLFLGSCLFRADRKDEARQEFETALRLAQLHGDKYQFEAERARQRLQELK